MDPGADLETLAGMIAQECSVYPADYPQEIRGLFAVAWDFLSVEPPDYLLQLSPELYAQEQQRVAQRFEEAVRLAEQAFVSEFAILKGMIDGGRYFTTVFYLSALSIVFVGMSAVVLPIVYGTPAKRGAAVTEQIALPDESSTSEPWWSVVPPLMLKTRLAWLPPKAQFVMDSPSALPPWE